MDELLSRGSYVIIFAKQSCLANLQKGGETMSYSSNIHLTKDEFYDLLVKKAQSTNSIPTRDEVDADVNMPMANSYAYHFGSFEKAIDQLKLDIRRGKISGNFEQASVARVLPIAVRPKPIDEQPKEDVAKEEIQESPEAPPAWAKGLNDEQIQLIKELIAFTESYHRLPVFNPSKKNNDGRSLPHPLSYYKRALFGDWDFAMQLVLKATNSEVVQGKLVKKEVRKRGDDMKKDKDTDVDLLRSMVRVFNMHSVMPNVSNWSRYKNELKYGYQTYVKRLGYGAYETLKNMAIEASRLNSPTDEELETIIDKWRNTTAQPEAANSEATQEKPEYAEEVDSEEVLEATECEENPESFSIDPEEADPEPESSEEATRDDENSLDDDTGEVDDSDDSDGFEDTPVASEDDFEGERAESEYSEEIDEPEDDGSFEESDDNEEEESDESESEEDTVIFSQSLQGAYFEGKDESENKFIQDIQVGGFNLHYEYDKETSKEILTIDDDADETLYEVVQRLSGLRTTTITR